MEMRVEGRLVGDEGWYKAGWIALMALEARAG